MADVDRPQGDRQVLHDHLAGAVLHCRHHGARDPDPAGRSQRLVGLVPDLQRVVHHARQPDALPLCRSLRLRRPGQLCGSAAGRGARHGLPPSERTVLLALPQWLLRHDGRLPRRRWRRLLRVGGLRPAVGRHQLPRRRGRPLAHGAGIDRILGHLHRRQPDRHDLLPPGARHDHVPGADLLLGDAGHRRADPDCVPGAVRRRGAALL